MNDYGIWLSFNNQEEGFQIPINPPSISAKDSSGNKTYNISGLGGINVLKDPELTEFTFKGTFPAQKSPLVNANILLEPRQYINLIKKWMGSKRPIRFIFTGSTFDINTPASIENFEYEELGGAVGDIEYTITLKKYVFYAAQKVKIKPAESAKKVTVAKKELPPRPDDRPPVKTYKLVKGDSLWKIAQKVLGNGARFKEIQKLNNIKDSDLKKLPIGLEVKLPPK